MRQRERVQFALFRTEKRPIVRIVGHGEYGHFIVPYQCIVSDRVMDNLQEFFCLFAFRSDFQQTADAVPLHMQHGRVLFVCFNFLAPMPNSVFPRIEDGVQAAIQQNDKAFGGFDDEILEHGVSFIEMDWVWAFPLPQIPFQVV